MSVCPDCGKDHEQPVKLEFYGPVDVVPMMVCPLPEMPNQGVLLAMDGMAYPCHYEIISTSHIKVTLLADPEDYV